MAVGGCVDFTGVNQQEAITVQHSEMDGAKLYFLEKLY